MEPYIPIIVTAAIGLIVGFVVAKIIEKSSASQALNSAKRAAEGILKEAKVDAESMKKEKSFRLKKNSLSSKRNTKRWF